MQEKVSVSKVIKYAGAYIALEIGSGFATGQEILQFYSSYGAMSIPASLLSMALFSWAGSRVMVTGYELRSGDTSQPYQLICGKRLGTFYEYFVLFYLFAGLSVMISGAGASMQEYCGVSYYAGGVFMALLVFCAFAFGLKKLIDVVGLMGPLIIGFTLFVAIRAVWPGLGELLDSGMDAGRFEAIQPAPNWWMSGVLYAAYNLVSSLAFLMALGRDASSAREAAAGGVVGGILLVLTAIFMNAALLANSDGIEGSIVPTLKLASAISPLVGSLFVFIMLCGIFSTAAPILWTICRNLAREGSKASLVIALLVSLDALLLGQLPFDKLVAVIYPVSGYMGLFLLLCIGRYRWTHRCSGGRGRRSGVRLDPRR